MSDGLQREAFATDEHGKSEPEALATVSKEEAFATDEHGKSEPEALATVSKEKAFATDEHGITRKSRIKAFSPRRRKERKGKQEIITCLLLLSVLAVKILGFGGFCKEDKKSAGEGAGI